MDVIEELKAYEENREPPSSEKPLEINLTVPQARVFNSNARFRVNVAGRRSGKTYLARTELFVRANNIRNSRNWYVAPTYRMAKQILWQELKELVYYSGRMAGMPNETDLSIRLLNGSTISLRGADNPDSLRGVGIDFLVMDEVQDTDEETWTAVLGPALADRGGHALFSGTPKGYNWFYDMWQRGHEDANWSSHKCTTLEAGIVPPEEIDAQRKVMDARLFRQEFEASFETLAGRVYQPFDRNIHVTDEVQDYGGEIMVGMDFNVNPMCAVVAQRVADQLHVFDEVVLPDANTDLMAKELLSRFSGRAATVYPDPAGRQRKTSAALGETDLTILERYGFRVIAPRKAPLVVDRINEVNALLESADGDTRLFIHPRCKHLIKCLEGLVYKDGTSAPDKKANLDHAPDALGYLVHSEFPINGDIVGMAQVRGYY